MTCYYTVHPMKYLESVVMWCKCYRRWYKHTRWQDSSSCFGQSEAGLGRWVVACSLSVVPGHRTRHSKWGNPCLTRHYSHQSHCSLQEAWGAFRPPSDSDPLEEADVEGWVPSCVGVFWGHWEGGEEEASDFAVGSPLRCAGSRPCVGVEVQYV